MAWKKLGLVFSPVKDTGWMHSHCQLPVADHIRDDIYRVYFASRDVNNISRIGFVEFDIMEPNKIISYSATPVLEPGDIGCFDQYGVFPASILNIAGKKYLYYIGWVRGYEAPLFYASIGLAVSDDSGGVFTKYSKAPVMDKGEHDPCLVTSPHILIDEGIFKMTYVSGIKWERDATNTIRSYYHIKYAESSDGINWRRDGKVAIGLMDDESNIARSSVLKEDDIYKMWYCYVKRSVGKYRIGYAESPDCMNWVRKDHMAGITVSGDDFDNEMICYPNVFKHKGTKYLVYNGNNYGQDGFGLAVFE